jgi:hypothetical protein
VAVAGAIFQLSLLGRFFAAVVPYPWDIEWLESTWLYQAYRYAHGLSVFGPPRDGYVAINHPPGYTATLGLFGRVIGIGYVMGRTISLLCFVGAAAIVTRALVRHCRGRLEGWALAALAVGCAAAGLPVIEGFYALIREDGMALLFSVIGAALVDGTLPVPGDPPSRKMRPRRIVLLSLVIAAIVYTRQVAVFFPVWLVLFVLARHRKSGLLLALGATVACSLVLVGLMLTSKGWYWLHTIALIAGHTLLPDRFARGMKILFEFAPFAPAMLIVALVLAGLRRLSARAALWVGMAVASLPASVLPFAKVGGFSNDFLPSVFLIGPAAAFVVADLLAAVRGAADAPRTLWRALIALALQWALFGGGAAFLFLRKYDYLKFVPSEDTFRRARALNARVASLQGGVISPRHPFLAIQNGDRTLQWSDMAYLDMLWAGFSDLDLAGYIDRGHAGWALMSGTELPGTAKEIAVRFQLADKLDAPSTRLGEWSSPRYLMKRNDDEKDGHVLFDFESMDGWTVTGNAFQLTTPKPGWQQPIQGAFGKHLANSFSPTGYDGARGTMLSPKFVIDRDHMSLRVGGGFHNGTRAELRVGGRTVRTATGIFEQKELLTRIVWDVGAWRGQEAQLALIDEDSGFWAHLLCDHVVLY